MRMILAAGGLAFALATGPAAAQGQLNLICAPQIEWCQALGLAFEKKTGTKVAVTQKSAGEILAQVRAEKDNPKIDVWFGGVSDAHLSAAEAGLLEPYTPKGLNGLYEWAQNIWATSRKHSVGVSTGVIGFGYNKELLAKKKLEPPKSWADLIKPAYKGEIQMANPNSSGTAYIIIATLVQIYGEEKAFAYLKDLHPNINAYTRSGVAPIKAVARGETGVSLSFMMDIKTEETAGFPVAGVYPSEGTGFEVAAMSIIKGARNLEQAKAFYDWYLTPEAMAIGAQVNQFHFPAVRDMKVDPRIPDVTQAKLINYDFAKYGSGAERKRLLERWDREIGALPR